MKCADCNRKLSTLTLLNADAGDVCVCVKCGWARLAKLEGGNA